MKKQSSTSQSSKVLTAAEQAELNRLNGLVNHQERKGNSDTLYHRQLADFLKSLGGKEELTDGKLE